MRSSTSLVAPRRTLAAIVMAIVGAGSAALADASSDPSAGRWLPLAQGNEWTLRDPTTGDTRDVRCTSAFSSYRELAGLFPKEDPSLWLYEDPAASDVFLWNDAQQGWYYFLRLADTSPASSWSLALTNNSADWFTAKWAPAGSTVVTPAGTFDGCLRLALVPWSPAPGAAAQDATALWLAPDVGLVQIEAGATFYQLAVATVGGKVYGSSTPNRPPVAGDVTASVAVGQSVDIDVLAKASDPDGDALSIVNVATPSLGAVVIANNLLHYTPNSGFGGTDTFDATIGDGKGGLAVAKVTVTVMGLSPVPTPTVTSAHANWSGGYEDQYVRDYSAELDLANVEAGTTFEVINRSMNPMASWDNPADRQKLPAPTTQDVPGRTATFTVPYTILRTGDCFEVRAVESTGVASAPVLVCVSGVAGRGAVWSDLSAPLIAPAGVALAPQADGTVHAKIDRGVEPYCSLAVVNQRTGATVNGTADANGRLDLNLGLVSPGTPLTFTPTDWGHVAGAFVTWIYDPSSAGGKRNP
jgi:hypothetical protein